MDLGQFKRRALRRLTIALGLIALLFSTLASAAEFSSAFPDGVERVWIGPEYYSNRLLDWRVSDGRLECLEGSKARPMRTVHLLSHSLADTTGAFSMRVMTGPIEAGSKGENTWTGFLIGVGGGDVDYRISALTHHWPGEDGGIIAAMDGAGRVVFRDNGHTDGPRGGSGAPPRNLPASTWPLLHTPSTGATGVGRSGLVLELRARPVGAAYELTLTASDPESGALLDRATLVGVHPDSLRGNVALISHHSEKENAAGYWFRDWTLSGSKVQEHKERNFGPVLAALHTLSGDTLSMTAQMGPMGAADTREGRLEIQRGDEWETVATALIVDHSYTMTFRVAPWSHDTDMRYRVAYDLNVGAGGTRTFYYTGTIRKPPVDKEEFVVAAFTGHHISAQGRGHWNSRHIWFPHNELVQAVNHHAPDLLFFSGDQIYEGGLGGIVRNPPEKATLDYLYHWYRWCWAFRDLARDIPTITIPDDHDVYHGNIWGAGGRKAVAKPGLRGTDAGGYVMDPLFVNAVHRTQVAHLPPPVDPAPIEQGITVYHTRVEYAGMSFAVIADRMWKSSPTIMVPDGEVVNGWFHAEDYDPSVSADVPGAVLLGDRQLAFLDEWANDWQQDAWMKVLLSQTIFANVATLPEDAEDDGVVPRMRQPSFPGEYMEHDAVAADADSNGWPQSGRDKALRTIRRGFAFHIAGDQHLGSFIQYGVDEWKDAAFALCVPSIANLWPRRWFPPQPGANQKTGAPKYSGDFKDGFGNLVTVHAVSNPEPSGHEPAALYDRAPGYGIVRFNRASRTITVEVWPRWVDPSRPGAEQYPGWPITIAQQDNYSRHAAAYLPEVSVRGMADPVVQVIDESTGEIVYTLRIAGSTFKPKVFSEGTYTLLVGEPGTADVQRFTGLESRGSDAGRLEVVFEAKE